VTSHWGGGSEAPWRVNTLNSWSLTHEGRAYWHIDILSRLLSVSLIAYVYASFIGSRLTKTRLTLINHTQLRTKGQSAGYPQAQIEITFNSFQRQVIKATSIKPASSALVSSSLALLFEVKTINSSTVLSFLLSQCFTPPLRSIHTSCFPHAPCPPSWFSSLSSILTPVLRTCHLFKTTHATLGACLFTDPIWWSNFLRRGKPLKGGWTPGVLVWSPAGLVLG